MEDNALIAKIKELKKIQPDKEWLAFSRSKIKMEISARGNSFVSVLNFFGQPAAAVLSVFLLLTGAGFVAAKEARNSLPGDKLYALKIAMEKAELKMTADEMAKTRLEAEITGRRAQELTEIANLPTFAKEERTQKVEQAVDRISQQLAEATSLKDKLANSQGGDSQEAVDTAKSVKENAEKLKAAIDEAQKNLAEIPENKELAAKISDISDKLEKTNVEISEIIDNISETQGDVQKVDAGFDSNSTTSPVFVPGVE